MMECGGYEANFVEEPLDYLKCVICHLALRNPLMFIDCGHRVCHICFDQMQKYATQRDVPLVCPHDRVELDVSRVVEDKGISRAVLDLKVMCDNSSKGCEWIGELRDLQKHVDEYCHRKEVDVIKRISMLEETIKGLEQKNEQKDKQIAKLKCKVEKNDREIKNLKMDMEQRCDSLKKQVEKLSEKRKIDVRDEQESFSTQSSSRSLKIVKMTHR